MGSTHGAWPAVSEDLSSVCMYIYTSLPARFLPPRPLSYIHTHTNHRWHDIYKHPDVVRKAVFSILEYNKTQLEQMVKEMQEEERKRAHKRTVNIDAGK